jgi:hypothetical protein
LNAIIDGRVRLRRQEISPYWFEGVFAASRPLIGVHLFLEVPMVLLQNVASQNVNIT